MEKVERKYEVLRKQCQEQIAKHNETINLISNLRMIVFLTGTALGIYYFLKKYYLLFGIDLAIFLILFVALMQIHESYFQKRTYTTALQKINEDSLARIRGEWHAFEDDGREFCDDNHQYSQDLDIFGKGSIFQFINSATTYLGRLRLRDLLASPSKSPETIASRQEAVTDLAPKLEWRQRFMAYGRIRSKIQDPKDLIRWGKTVEEFHLKPPVIYACRLFPIITITIGLLTYLSPDRQYYALITALLLQFLLLKVKGKARSRVLEVAYKYLEDLKAYEQMLGLIESEPFNSKHLEKLKAKLKDKKGQTACAQIGKLAGIVDLIANRHSQFYIFFNIPFLLDYQFMFMLEKWKRQSGSRLQEWLDIVTEFEALASLSVLPHDYPEWAIPEITGANLNFKTSEMGHPLLISPVKNDLQFGQPENILLITGSNMSGKSTLLRSIGMNLVLAYAGTAVCARTFQCPIMDIYTCMRVNDNLEKNISSFYAELLRIKMLVQAVEEGKTVFFLLDEIFKGTNSIDRHTGAKALITKLSRAKVLGLISTHDLELGNIENENKKIKNYHFQEYYKDNRICFDYKLRPGVSKTRNAVYLMRMAGIEIEEPKLH